MMGTVRIMTDKNRFFLATANKNIGHAVLKDGCFLPTLREARALASVLLADAGVHRSVILTVLMADERVCLWVFGPRGGRHPIWTYGKISAVRQHFTNHGI